jgi:hypothetical protein
MGQDRGRSVSVFRRPDHVDNIHMGGSRDSTDWVRAHPEKDGIGQREDGLHFDRLLAWMATLQSNKMCWVLVTLFTTQ